MHFIENNFYHIYNRGNNKEVLFRDRNDYLRFLKNIAEQLFPACDILSWCLMPNHFHFLIYANSKSIETKKVGGLILQTVTNSIKLLLSSYAKYYNKKYNRTGNLFQQKTKAKLIDDFNTSLIVFNYIHQNPWKASLVKNIEDWEFSSFKDYVSLRNGKLCSIKFATELFDLNKEKLYEETCKAVNSKFEYLID